MTGAPRSQALAMSSARMPADLPVLEVDNLSVEFATAQGTAYAVNGVSWSVSAGETLAVLGESGSGKSVTAQAIMGILDEPPARIASGSIRFRGEDLLSMPERDRRLHRGSSIALVFQDALSALNPVYPVGWQIAEAIRLHQEVTRAEASRRAVDLLDRVKVPAAKERASDYPHQFSGGMRQRAMIAMAIALDPDVLIADEPTTALDVTVQAQVLDLLGELQAESGLGLVLITHDLGVIAQVADRIAVMYAGRIVEEASVEQIYAAAAHPYTRGLLRSVPTLQAKGTALPVIPGLPPNLTDLPAGCAFHLRCPRREEPRCTEAVPALRPLDATRTSACHFAEEVLHDSS